MDISILEKTPSAGDAGDLVKTPVKVHSAQKWVINTSFINDGEKHTVLKKTIEFIENANSLVRADVKIITLTNI